MGALLFLWARQSLGMISQEDRLGKLHAPGTDLVLVAFRGTEGVNTIGEFEVEVLSEGGSVNFTKLLGKNVTVEIETIDPDHPPRFFDGILTEASETNLLWGGMGYKLILRPWIWLLTLRKNQRIFHNKTAPQIIAEVLDDYSMPHHALVQGVFPELEYTVQFAETDYDFVTRLMSMYGINYVANHSLGSHMIFLFDEVDSLPEAPGGSRTIYPTVKQYRSDQEHFYDWRSERRMTTGRVMMLDYNFETPTKSMDAREEASPGYTHGKIESFIFPGGYPDKGDGEQLAKTRLKQHSAQDWHHYAEGDCLGVGPGIRVTVDSPDRAELSGRTFVGLSATHRFVTEGYRTGGGEAAETDSYTATYEFAETTNPVAPPEALATTPRAHGPQTAMVVGDGEIDCDKHGRILVKFHWDYNEEHSMRCRVAQLWAGNKWGGIVIPRVGMEVIVEFLGGDPSQPIVTGCVYNEDNKPPFDLPGDNMISGMKTNTTPGGGGYNELVFDDTSGNEEMRIHAQYNLNGRVLNDHTWIVENDRTTEIHNNEKLTVGKNRDTEIGISDTLDVTDTLKITAGQKILLQVGSSKIVIDNMSVTIESPTIELKAAMEFRSQAGIQSEHKAGGTYQVSGSIVLINT